MVRDNEVVIETAKRATIYDVAKAAHVATSTVSRALNRPGRTNPYTAQHVYRIALELGYISERDLWKTPRCLNNRVAVITSSRNSELIHALTREVNRAHQQLLLVDARVETPTLSQTCGDIRAQIDGFLVDDVKTNAEIETVFDTLPTVMMNRINEHSGGVIPDVEQGVAQLLTYLKTLGHAHISYLYSEDESWISDEFFAAALSLSQELEMEVHFIDGVENSLESGARAVNSWKKYLDSAVIAFGNLAAIGFMQGLGHRQVEIPEYVSVIGIGDAHSGLLATPQLTTLEIPQQKIGATAVKQLLNRIQQGNAAKESTTSVTKLPMKLICRESTGRFY
ncbi:LacI family transcriptional regulator [Mobiluncus holmesii]|uniref:LacI family transcriptional regulator n=1 Tax=Mobiluncus porci TaxID=2652278 RepID=A0A7K0K021_9ACTO|nr:LacI family DNA-binding transcriptional regulator [Mobiluncus porci]MST48822.1 LacI family transcriptional regulator [Mobiluncus porci]